MPIQVKAFACGFGCGAKVQTSKARMVSHESRCFKNTANKACATCEHDEFERAEPEEGISGGFYCAIEKRPEKVIGISNCEFWKLKVKDETK